MNEQQLAKSERIASKVMRILAIIGLVSILALVAWVLVQGFKVVPKSGEKLTAAVTSVSSFFGGGDESTLVFDLDTRTFESGKEMTIDWQYSGADEGVFQFSYTCADGVRAQVLEGGAVRDLACATPIGVSGTSLQALFTASSSRFADVELTLTRGAQKANATITVVTIDPTPISVASSTEPTVPAKKPTDVTPTPVSPAPVATPKPKPTRPVDLPVRTLSPGDLAVDIGSTGTLVSVKGKNTVVPISPIPSNKTAGVTFTVTNRGEKPTGAWAFRATLPIEGDSNYHYTSPLQTALKPGAQVTFTLGFDEVTDKKTGTIEIELIPSDKTDKESNNTDSVKVSFK